MPQRGPRRNEEDEGLITHRESRTGRRRKSPRPRPSSTLHRRFSHRNRSGERDGESIAGRSRRSSARKRRTRLARKIGGKPSHANLPRGSCIGVLQKEEKRSKKRTGTKTSSRIRSFNYPTAATESFKHFLRANLWPLWTTFDDVCLDGRDRRRNLRQCRFPRFPPISINRQTAAHPRRFHRSWAVHRFRRTGGSARDANEVGHRHMALQFGRPRFMCFVASFGSNFSGSKSPPLHSMKSSCCSCLGSANASRNSS